MDEEVLVVALEGGSEVGSEEVVLEGGSEGVEVVVLEKVEVLDHHIQALTQILSKMITPHKGNIKEGVFVDDQIFQALKKKTNHKEDLINRTPRA
jgi:hypothetical protein